MKIKFLTSLLPSPSSLSLSLQPRVAETDSGGCAVYFTPSPLCEVACMCYFVNLLLYDP